MSANAALPIPSKSNNPIIRTKDVSLNKPIEVLTIGGIDILKALSLIHI